MAKTPPAAESPGFSIEAGLRRDGVLLITGVDEAGRGCLAGPVVAAAVRLAPDWPDPGVADSKALSAKRREELAEAVRQSGAPFGLGLCGPGEVDELNIHRASLMAMRRAVDDMGVDPKFILIDGRFTIEHKAPQRAVVKGDALCRAIAAASILAKVARDEMMRNAHQRYPEYNFAGNKGYGTKEHQDALNRYGPCPLHRRSYRPVAQLSLGLVEPKP